MVDTIEEVVRKGTIKLKPERYSQWQRWLSKVGHEAPNGEVLDEATYRFGDGIKADIYVVSGEPKPYVDILFLDQNNSSIANCEPLLGLSEGRMLELDNNKYKIQFERNIK